MNTTPTEERNARRQGRPGYKTDMGRDRLQETTPPLMAGHCDFCGSKFPDGTPAKTRRGDARKYCTIQCRKWMRAREQASATFIFNRMMIVRMFKHADPSRANAARAELATHFNDLFDRIDAERQSMTEKDGAPRATTRAIRAAAKGGER